MQEEKRFLSIAKDLQGCITYDWQVGDDFPEIGDVTSVSRTSLFCSKCKEPLYYEAEVMGGFASHEDINCPKCNQFLKNLRVDRHGSFIPKERFEDVPPEVWKGLIKLGYGGEIRCR